MNSIEPIVEYCKLYGGFRMDLLHVFLSTMGSIIALFFLTKMIGYRQVSQLSMFDYVNGITIGSIAAEMATSLQEDMLKPLLAMTIYAVVGVLLSVISDKSVKLSRFIEGKPLVIYDNGQIYFERLKKAKLDVGEVLTQCRISGYFDLSEIQTIILEDNGHMSILPKSEYRQIKTNDMQIKPPPEHLVANLIIDGYILKENLKNIGKNEVWLTKKLSSNHILDVKEVLLATCDCNEKVHIYKRIRKDYKNDILD